MATRARLLRPGISRGCRLHGPRQLGYLRSRGGATVRLRPAGRRPASNIMAICSRPSARGCAIATGRDLAQACRDTLSAPGHHGAVGARRDCNRCHATSRKSSARPSGSTAIRHPSDRRHDHRPRRLPDPLLEAGLPLDRSLHHRHSESLRSLRYQIALPIPTGAGSSAASHQRPNRLESEYALPRAWGSSARRSCRTTVPPLRHRADARLRRDAAGEAGGAGLRHA